MLWKTVSHISKNLEINKFGDVRFAHSQRTLHSFYNNHAGFHELDLKIDGSDKPSRTNIHELVAIYFLNNGEKLSNNNKVVFKNGDVSNYSSDNLEIVNKSQHTNFKAPKPIKELYVSYGDEIYC
jgi:hypothetical protein